MMTCILYCITPDTYVTTIGLSKLYNNDYNKQETLCGKIQLRNMM